MTISRPGSSASTPHPSAFVTATRPRASGSSVGVGAEQDLAPFEDGANDPRVLQVHVHQCGKRHVAGRGDADLMPLGDFDTEA